MNLDHLHDKLVRAARSVPVDDRVPFAFERRILARIKSGPIADDWAAWGQALWRASAPCVGICLLLLAWSCFVPEATSSGEEFTQALDNTVLVAADPGQVGDIGW